METFFTTLRLETAYSINNLQYHLRKWPLIKKLFPPSYEIQEVKLCFAILGFIRDFGMGFLINLFYFAAMGFMAVLRTSGDDIAITSGAGPLFLILLIAGSLIGGLLHAAVLNGDYNDYFAICQLRMDARKYVLSRYLFSLAKQLLLSMFSMLLVCTILRLSFWFMLIVPLFLAGIKFAAIAFRMWLYEKNGKIHAPTISDGLAAVWVVVICAAAFALLGFNVQLPTLWLGAGMTIIGLLGCLCAPAVFGYEGYYIYFKRYYTEMNEIKLKTTANVVNNQTNKLDLKTANQTSNKSGFAYMNELFLLRHHKVLMDKSRIIALIGAGIFVLIIAVVIFADSADAIQGNVIRSIPFMPFIFYMINQGAEYSAALFVNCDRSMLNYSFYRKRKNILSLFKLRLLGISKQNLLPATVISVGLVLLEVICALLLGTPEAIKPLDLLVLALAPVCISICFSVHYLMLYYVLQPFDHEAKSKSPAYNIALGLTYIICYELYQVIGKIENLNPLVFAGCLVAFCIVYSLIAYALVFAFAPKNFKNRR